MNKLQVLPSLFNRNENLRLWDLRFNRLDFNPCLIRRWSRSIYLPDVRSLIHYLLKIGIFQSHKRRDPLALWGKRGWGTWASWHTKLLPHLNVGHLPRKMGFGSLFFSLHDHFIIKLGNHSCGICRDATLTDFTWRLLYLIKGVGIVFLLWMLISEFRGLNSGLGPNVSLIEALIWRNSACIATLSIRKLRFVFGIRERTLIKGCRRPLFLYC
jgi:hypothetical protein